jgi:hypothetical protein
MEVYSCNTSYTEIGRIVVQDQPRQKVSKILISTNRPGIVVHNRENPAGQEAEVEGSQLKAILRQKKKKKKINETLSEK